MCGCMLKQLNFTKEEDEEYPKTKIKSGALEFNISALFIVVQVFCSCLAGVYNEYLLKETGANVNIFVQNVFMYLDSIVCNILVLTLKGDILYALTLDSLSKVFHYKVIVIMINNCAIGIITSFFLKTLNSILKTFASALELVLTAVCSFLLFSIPIHLNTVLALMTVLFAVYLYTQNPVTNVPHPKSVDQIEVEARLPKEIVWTRLGYQ